MKTVLKAIVFLNLLIIPLSACTNAERGPDVMERIDSLNKDKVSPREEPPRANDTMRTGMP
ncbi:MAG: hypothetical protein AB1458_09810 [Bacteroidota bacterium]